MEYEIKEEGHFHVLIIDEKLDFYNVNEFKKIFFEVIDGKYSHVAVELKGNVNEMSSSVLGALVTGQKKFSALKGMLAIINVGESVKNVMFVAGLSNFFTLVDDYDELITK